MVSRLSTLIEYHLISDIVAAVRTGTGSGGDGEEDAEEDDSDMEGMCCIL